MGKRTKRTKGATGLLALLSSRSIAPVDGGVDDEAALIYSAAVDAKIDGSPKSSSPIKSRRTEECVAFSAVKNDPLLRAQNRRRLENKLDVGVLKSSSCHGSTEINTVRSGMTPNMRNLQLSDAALLDECSGKCPDSKLCDCE